jgi:iron complex transport system substrate-binding protein
MKMERSYFTGLILAVSVLWLVPGGLLANPLECVTDDGSSIDYFPDKVKPVNSQFWDVQYFNYYKILVNKIVNESYVLYQCGTEPPSITSDSFGKQPAVVVPIPLADGVALTSTVQIPFMELLGLRTEIKSYIGDPQYISSSCILKLIDENVLNTYENTTSPAILNWTSTNPDRVVLDATYGGLPDNPVVQDQTMLISEQKEASNKAIFEWLKFYSTLFNMEAVANQIVNETAARYDCVSSNANTMAQADTSVPTAVWAYYSDYPGYEGWNLASCDPVFNYYCEYAKDCHVNLLSSDELMSHTNFSNFAKDADVFFYMSTDWDEVYAKNSGWLEEFKSVQNKEVYDYQKSGPNAWFEQRLAEYGNHTTSVLFWFLLLTRRSLTLAYFMLLYSALILL